MIIKFPTGLYDTVLPHAPSDGGNVTFTISASPPPRRNLIFPKIPRGVKQRQRQPATLDEISIRGSLGELIFSISRASQTEPGSNAKQFEIGQIVEFGAVTEQTVAPMLVSTATETRHDTNVFDYSSLGLSADERKLLADSALVTHKDLQVRLNLIKSGRADAERDISEQQKKLNESNRNISALQIMAKTTNDPAVQQLLDKFKKISTDAQAAVDEAVTLANSYAAQATDIQNQLLALAVVVK